MPINAYVASRGAKPAGLTRAAPAEEDFPTARMPVYGACEFDAAPPPQPQPALPLSDGKKPSELLLLHLDPNEMDEEQQAAVWTLLKYFKSRGL